MKDFFESLTDGFTHITEITDPDLLQKLREDHIRVDAEGYYTFVFGEHKEFEWRVEPIGDDGNYLMALYKNGILLTEKLNIWAKKKEQ